MHVILHLKEVTENHPKEQVREGDRSLVVKLGMLNLPNELCDISYRKYPVPISMPRMLALLSSRSQGHPSSLITTSLVGVLNFPLFGMQSLMAQNTYIIGGQKESQVQSYA